MIGTDSYLITIEFPDKADKNSTSDYRYSGIEVTVINLSNMGSGDLEPLKAQSLGKGVIRLFRELEDEDGEVSSFNISDHTTEVIAGDDTMVAIVAVPTYFTATDLLGFIGESNMKHISHIRILKSDKPNRFLVLIKFTDIVKAAEFHHHFNGKTFNSMEPETCHVVYVKGVQTEHLDKQVDDRENTLIPFLLQDPFTSPAPSLPNSPNSKGFSLISEKPLMELPTCPVCLERMDATVTGLLTIPCQHTFHCQCLSKWKDDTCPICRYSNNFSNLKVRRTVRRLSQIALPRRRSSALEQEVPETCFDCTDNENLWICLICGNVGCSRYADGKHSLKHFIDTGHCFAMEVNTSRVWDYAGDNYVHRLVTNESDGKLVELPDKNSNSDKAADEKVDELGFEYSQLLVSQLASQRDYYESLLQEHDAPKSRRGSKPVDLETTVEKLTEKLANLTDQIVPNLRDKISQKDAKLNSIYKELNTSNTINNALSAKVDYLVKSNGESQLKIKQLEEENKALNEQVTDLMFFLDSQEKFKDEPQDVKDGTIVVQQPPTSSRRSHKKKH